MYKSLKTIFTIPLLFHIAISDQNRELDAMLRMSLDLQSAQRQRTQSGNVSHHICGYYAFFFLYILHMRYLPMNNAINKIEVP